MGTVKGKSVLVGARRFMNREGVDLSQIENFADESERLGRTVFYVAVNDKARAIVALEDTVREGSEPAIQRLDASRIETVLLSGDRPAAAQSLAGQK